MRLVSSYSIALLMMALCAAAGTAAARYLPDNGVFKGASVNARKTLHMVGSSASSLRSGSATQVALDNRNPMPERIVVASSTKWPVNASRQSAPGSKASD